MNIDTIVPTAAVALADAARELELKGQKILKLQTGDPDFDTHPFISDAAYEAIMSGLTHYSFSQGLPDLRNKIAEQINSELSNTLVDHNWVLITNGAAEGIYATMAALIEPGDEVIVLEPNWPTVDSLAILMGGLVKKVNSLNSLTEILQELNEKRTDKTRIICFNSPNNPTGMVYSQDMINAICSWAIQNDIYILADEVYRFIQFGEYSTTSIQYLKDYQKYIFIDSFSKKFAMTGWRIGYVVAHPTVLKRILKASQLTITHVAPFVQKAALAALSRDEVLAYSNEMRQAYKERLKRLTDECNELGLEYLLPQGAFYLFIKLGIDDDKAFCYRLLNEFHTCAVPGSAFGQTGKGYLRLSYAVDINVSISGLAQIANCLKNTVE